MPTTVYRNAEGGYTQVAEFHYLHHGADGNPYANRGEMTGRLSQAAQQAGIGMTLLPVLYSYAGFGAQPAQPGQNVLFRMRTATCNSSR